MRPPERDAQWCSGCYRDLCRTKHIRLRRYFTKAMYIAGNWRWGYNLGVGVFEVSILWGLFNKAIMSKEIK